MSGALRYHSETIVDSEAVVWTLVGPDTVVSAGIAVVVEALKVSAVVTEAMVLSENVVLLELEVESVGGTDIMEDVVISGTMVEAMVDSETRAETVMVRDAAVEDSESVVEAKAVSEFLVEVVIGKDIVVGGMVVSETVVETVMGTDVAVV